MALGWQKLGAGPVFKGLLDRRQEEVDDLAYFLTLQNVDLSGGALGKRAGTRTVNGHFTHVSALAPSTETLVVVDDARGFTVGQSVTIAGVVRTLTAFLEIGAPNYIWVSPALPSPPVAGDLVVQVFPATNAIETLHQAVFRDGTKHLLAMADGHPVRIVKGAAPVALTEAYPTTTVIMWAGVTGTLNSVQGLVVGDWIHLGAPTNLDVRVTAVAVLGLVAVTPTPGVPPTPGTWVTFFPTRATSGRPPMAVQYANLAHVVTPPPAGAPSSVPPQPPIKVRNEAGTLRVYRHGIRPPSYAFTGIGVMDGAGGLLAGQTYRYRVRYYNSATDQESEGGPESVVVLGGAHDAVSIVLYGSPDPQVDQVRVYRSSTNGAGAWYRLPGVKIAGTWQTMPIANPMPPSTTTIVDISADATLGLLMRNLLDVCMPDTVGVVTVWGQANRLVGIDFLTNTVVFSDQPDLASGGLKGESWPVNNQIFVSHDDGDKLVAIASFFDSLVIFKEHSVWRVTGVPPDIRIEPVHYRADRTSTGVRSQRSVVVDHDEILFIGSDAIYQFSRFEGIQSGFRSTRVSLPIDERLLAGINADMDSWAEMVLPELHAVYFRHKRQIRLWVSSNRALVYQLDGGLENEPTGWAEWRFSERPDVPFPLMQMRCSAVVTDDTAWRRGVTGNGGGPESVVLLGTSDGMVLQMDTGQADWDCAPYEVRLDSLRFTPAGRGAWGRARALDLEIAVMAAMTATVGVQTDESGAGTTLAVALTPNYSSNLTPDRIDLMATELPVPTPVGVRHLVRGQWHQWTFTERSRTSFYRILGWAYWFQALGPQVVRRAFALAQSPDVRA